MNITQDINTELENIVQLKDKISRRIKNNENYLEEKKELKDLEKLFSDKYNSFLEEVFFEVYDELCPDSESRKPIEYVPGFNTSKSKEINGVSVEVDDYPGENTRLVLLPSPLRVVLKVGDTEEEVWSTNKLGVS